MKKVSQLFQFLWSIYLGCIFSSMIFIMFIFFVFKNIFFKNRFENEFKDMLFRGVGKAILFLGLVRVKNVFHTKYKPNVSYVVVGNHNAALDIPINTSSCPKELNIKFLGKAEAAKIPLLGAMITKISILVDRKNPESRKHTYELMAKEIKKAYSIFIYPEGTRNRTTEPIKPFYNGAFKLAIDHQLPLIVCTLIGTKEINAPDRIFSYKPGKVIAHWDEEISTVGKTIEDIPALKKRVYEIMLHRLNQHKN